MKVSSLTIALGLVGLSAARTDLGGCVSSATVNQWDEASLIWYVPDSGEICDIPDCGGGRAPPKTDQPGCPLYSGTATLTPSYLSGYGPNGKMTATTSTVSATASDASSSVVLVTADTASSHTTIAASNQVTPAPTESPAVSKTTTSSPSSANSSAVTSATSTPTGNAAAGSNFGSSGAIAMALVAIGAFA